MDAAVEHLPLRFVAVAVTHPHQRFAVAQQQVEAVVGGGFAAGLAGVVLGAQPAGQEAGDQVTARAGIGTLRGRVAVVGQCGEAAKPAHAHPAAA